MDLSFLFTEHQSLWQKLACTNKPIILYGMGNGADKIINQLKKINIKIYGVMASDNFVRYQNFQGYTVKKLSDFEKELDDFLILLSFGSDLENVMNDIKKINENYHLLVPTVSLFGNEIVDDKFIVDNIEKINKAYMLLEDEKSKSLFTSLLQFMYTGELHFLSLDSTTDEIYEILNLSDKESYLDLGAYDGDTVIEFIDHVNDYSYISAVEPNIKNYTKLKKNTEKYKNIEYINKGIEEKETEKYVIGKSGRMSYISDTGERKISTTSLDTLSKERKFTYIKADIEGMEEKMINGGKNTLSEKPKLRISAYHKPSDLFTLILKINDINQNYKFYLRKLPYIPAWDIMLIAI